MTSTGNHFFNQLKSFVYGIEQDIQHYSDEESLSSLESEKCLIKLKENIKAMQNQYNDLENSVFGKPECRLSHVSIDEFNTNLDRMLSANDVIVRQIVKCFQLDTLDATNIIENTEDLVNSNTVEAPGSILEESYSIRNANESYVEIEDSKLAFEQSIVENQYLLNSSSSAVGESTPKTPQPSSLRPKSVLSHMKSQFECPEWVEGSSNLENIPCTPIGPPIKKPCAARDTPMTPDFDDSHFMSQLQNLSSKYTLASKLNGQPSIDAEKDGDISPSLPPAVHLHSTYSGGFSETVPVSSVLRPDDHHNEDIPMATSQTFKLTKLLNPRSASVEGWIPLISTAEWSSLPLFLQKQVSINIINQAIERLNPVITDASVQFTVDQLQNLLLSSDEFKDSSEVKIVVMAIVHLKRLEITTEAGIKKYRVKKFY